MIDEAGIRSVAVDRHPLPGVEQIHRLARPGEHGRDDEIRELALSERCGSARRCWCASFVRSPRWRERRESHWSTVPRRCRCAQILDTSEQEAVEAVRRAGEDMRLRAPGHRMSALQDLEAGRPLEVEETFGYAVRKAREHGLSLPLLEAFHHLVAGIDHMPRDRPALGRLAPGRIVGSGPPGAADFASGAASGAAGFASGGARRKLPTVHRAVHRPRLPTSHRPQGRELSESAA